MTTHNSNKREEPTKPSTAKRILIIVALLLVAGLASVLYWFSGGKTQSTEQTVLRADAPLDIETQADGSVRVIPNAKPARTFVTGVEDLPRSLQGTDVDGEIIIDENKQLVVTNGLRRLFDYFLTTQGEEDLATIIERVEAYISHRVPEPARTQAITLFHQYLAYLQATSSITEAGGKPAAQIDIDAVVQQKQQLADLRKQYFNDEVIEAFWGDEDRYDDYSIALLRINKDASLSEAQKAQARNELVTALPNGAMKQQIIEQKKFTTLIDETRKLKAKGASPEQLRQLRVELYDEEVADRLEALDVKRDAWQTRVQTYLDERAQILSKDLTDEAKTVEVNALRYRMFTEQEQKRLTAYEEIGSANLDAGAK